MLILLSLNPWPLHEWRHGLNIHATENCISLERNSMASAVRLLKCPGGRAFQYFTTQVLQPILFGRCVHTRQKSQTDYLFGSWDDNFAGSPKKIAKLRNTLELISLERLWDTHGQPCLTVWLVLHWA